MLISDRFFWVRAQIDYLQRLPNDTEKRKALRTLPPDLRQTYIRILETIDRTYPEQTVIYIQRLLKWLVLHDDLGDGGFSRDWRGRLAKTKLTTEILCQAVCIENEDEWPTDEITSTLDNIFQWLGCLVRLEVDSHADGVNIQLSHFTIKEFLVMSPEKISSSIARRYLVASQDHNYIDHVFLKYVMHSRFAGIVCSSRASIEEFLSQHPLYPHVAWKLCDRLCYWDGLQGDGIELLQRFLSMPASRHFGLWDTCATHMADRGNIAGIHSRTPSPLHFAAVTGLTNMTQRLLDEGADPDTTGDSKLLQMTPLHLAIICGSQHHVRFRGHRYAPVIGYYDSNGYHRVHERRRRSLRVAEILVDSGAHVNQQLIITWQYSRTFSFRKQVCVTPLTLALFCHTYNVANLLLGLGADLNATANAAYITDICSVESFMQEFNVGDQGEKTVQDLIEFSKHDGLRKILEEWRAKKEEEEKSLRPIS